MTRTRLQRGFTAPELHSVVLLAQVLHFSYKHFYACCLPALKTPLKTHCNPLKSTTAGAAPLLVRALLCGVLQVLGPGTLENCHLEANLEDAQSLANFAGKFTFFCTTWTSLLSLNVTDQLLISSTIYLLLGTIWLFEERKRSNNE